jgi:uncharacterized protein YceK
MEHFPHQRTAFPLGKGLSMNRRRLAVLLLTAIVAAVAGCGTVLNLDEEQGVYGGVRTDAAMTGLMAHALTDECHKLGRRMTFAIGLAAFADIPLSAIADTLTLPITIPATLTRHAGNNQVEQFQAPE